ncbi:MAG: thioredoxin [bacterium]|nr:thioredoxin [bacterium]
MANGLVIKCVSCGAKNRVQPHAAVERKPICGKCGVILPAPSMEPVIVTDANFAELVEGSPTAVLLDLWAAWCGPCRILAPTIEALARELAGRVVVGKLDVDANQRTAARFGVQSIPTLMIVKDGREVDRLVGLQSREAILQRLKAYL